VAQKGQIVAVFAQEKSIAYSYFFDKTSEAGREMATAAVWGGMWR